MELEKYKIDIAALSETRFSESGRLDDMATHSSGAASRTGYDERLEWDSPSEKRS